MSRVLSRDDLVERGREINAELIERESTLDEQIATVERLRKEYDGILAVMAHFFVHSGPS